MCPDRPLSSSFLFLFVVYFSQYLFLLYIIFMSDKKAWNFPVSLFGLQVLLVRVLLDRAELCVPDPSLLAGRHWSLRQEISTLRLMSSDSYLFKVGTFLSVLNYCFLILEFSVEVAGSRIPGLRLTVFLGWLLTLTVFQGHPRHTKKTCLQGPHYFPGLSMIWHQRGRISPTSPII